MIWNAKVLYGTYCVWIMINLSTLYVCRNTSHDITQWPRPLQQTACSSSWEDKTFNPGPDRPCKHGKCRNCCISKCIFVMYCSLHIKAWLVDCKICISSKLFWNKWYMGFLFLSMVEPSAGAQTYNMFFISSPEMEAQVSFSDHNLSVVCCPLSSLLLS